VCIYWFFRSVRFRVSRWESDDFRFEFFLGFVLDQEFQNALVHEVLNGPASSIRQFSKFSYNTLIEFI
jgi:hypothetical protein